MSEDNINSSKSERFHHRALSILGGSSSDQNVYFTYVCLCSEVNPVLNANTSGSRSLSFHLLDGAEEVNYKALEDEPIQVERSKAVHELVQTCKKKYGGSSSTDKPSSTSINAENSDHYESIHDNPKVLKLTKMKWLSEDREGTDSSSPSVSPARSSTSSNLSQDSGDDIASHPSLGEKYLSTILRLDKEHNMFGLSNIAIVGSKQIKKVRKDDDRPVFHQTAIVQVCTAKGCCSKACCRHKTNTDLPSSLKCGGCGHCFQCMRTSCTTVCSIPCRVPPAPKREPCRKPFCPTCRQSRCTCKLPIFCPPKNCVNDCCYGFTIKLNKKPKFEPPAVELTPRNSCILQRPYISRPCPHYPRCCPPSTCFPYLMPCFWPSRPSAPCHDPGRCFHHPPCMPPRRPRPCAGVREVCQKPCNTCANTSCLGTNKTFKEALENRYGKPVKSQTTPTSPPKSGSPPKTAKK